MRSSTLVFMLVGLLLLVGCSQIPGVQPTVQRLQPTVEPALEPTELSPSEPSKGAQAWHLGEITRLEGIAALGPDDVWAVGENGIFSVVAYWDGKTWQRAAQIGDGLIYPMSAGGQDKLVLKGITAISKNDIWAVGYAYEPYSDASSRAVLARWDGKAWGTAPNPYPGDVESELLAVSGTSSNDVWAVGTADGKASIVHWDGKAWTNSNVEYKGGVLNAVAARSKDDVWAVGTAGTGPPNGGGRSLTFHWNGKEWNYVPSPNAEHNSSAPLTRHFSTSLQGIAIVDENDVWAVGYASEIWHGNREPMLMPVVMRWDGSMWNMEAPKNDGKGNQSLYPPLGQLQGVVALARDNVWVVASGQAGTSVAKWNGHSWEGVPCPFNGIHALHKYTPTSITAIARVAPDRVLVDGTFNAQHIAGGAYIIEPYTGPCPTATPIPTEPPPPTLPPAVPTGYPAALPSVVVPVPEPSTGPLP